MKKNSQLLTAFILLILFTGCQGQSGNNKLSPNSFEAKLNSLPDKIVLDVRTQDEYNRGHIPNSSVVDYYGRDFKAKLNQLDKSKPVFVYCASGARSSSAVKTLVGLGFKEIYDLQGGFNAWTDAKKPVEK